MKPKLIAEYDRIKLQAYEKRIFREGYEAASQQANSARDALGLKLWLKTLLRPQSRT
jgi:hypothetical protein